MTVAMPSGTPILAVSGLRFAYGDIVAIDGYKGVRGIVEKIRYGQYL